VPFVDTSESARAFFTFAGLVGAAMCSGCRCRSHDRWPLYPPRINAMVPVGCPDRRLDRLCTTCCSPLASFTARRMSGAISFMPQAGRGQ